jgi:hypothetical protein
LAAKLISSSGTDDASHELLMRSVQRQLAEEQLDLALDLIRPTSGVALVCLPHPIIRDLQLVIRKGARPSVAVEWTSDHVTDRIDKLAGVTGSTVEDWPTSASAEVVLGKAIRKELRRRIMTNVSRSKDGVDLAATHWIEVDGELIRFARWRRPMLIPTRARRPDESRYDTSLIAAPWPDIPLRSSWARARSRRV